MFYEQSLPVLANHYFLKNVHCSLVYESRGTYIWLGSEKTQAGADYLYHTGFTGTAIGMKKRPKEALILLTNRIHPTREERGFLKARTKFISSIFRRI